MKKKLKILLWDIEILPHKIEAYCWNPWQIIKPVDSKIIEESSIVTIAYKWFDEKAKPAVLKVKASDVRNDKEVLKQFSKVVEEADYIVGHYSDKFDLPFFNGRLFRHKLPPIATTKALDTFKMFKGSILNRWSNRLDYIAKMRGHEGKSKTDWSLWQGCMDGKQSSIDKMGRYNAQDIIVLEKIFRDILPYSKVNLVTTSEVINCTGCGNLRLEKRGFLRTLKKIYQRYMCKNCGKWSKGELIKGE